MTWVRWGGILMFLGVALGAFGSHLLRSRIDAFAMEMFRAASFYHFVHALAIFLVAWLSTVSRDPKIMWAGIFLSVGIFLFSGSLYLYSVTGIKALGAITPLGGLSFLIAWILIILCTIS